MSCTAASRAQALPHHGAGQTTTLDQPLAAAGLGTRSLRPCTTSREPRPIPCTPGTGGAGPRPPQEDRLWAPAHLPGTFAPLRFQNCFLPPSLAMAAVTSSPLPAPRGPGPAASGFTLPHCFPQESDCAPPCWDRSTTPLPIRPPVQPGSFSQSEVRVLPSGPGWANGRAGEWRGGGWRRGGECVAAELGGRRRSLGRPCPGVWRLAWLRLCSPRLVSSAWGGWWGATGAAKRQRSYLPLALCPWRPQNPVPCMPGKPWMAKGKAI